MNRYNQLPHMPGQDPYTQHHKGMEVLRDGHCPSSHHGCENIQLPHSGEGLSTGTWNESSHQDGWVIFIPLDEGGLLNLYLNLIVLLQTGPLVMHYTWNGTYTIERGEQVRVLVWHIPPPVHLHAWQCGFPPPAWMICTTRSYSSSCHHINI